MPNVSGPPPGNRPIAGQIPVGINETQSNESPQTLTKSQQDTLESPAAREASSKEKSEKKLEKSMETSLLQDMLNAKLPEKEGKKAKEAKPKATVPVQKEAKSKTPTQVSSEAKPKIEVPIDPKPKDPMEAQKRAAERGQLQQTTSEVIKDFAEAIKNTVRKLD